MKHPIFPLVFLIETPYNSLKREKCRHFVWILFYGFFLFNLIPSEIVLPKINVQLQYNWYRRHGVLNNVYRNQWSLTLITFFLFVYLTLYMWHCICGNIFYMQLLLRWNTMEKYYGPFKTQFKCVCRNSI